MLACAFLAFLPLIVDAQIRQLGDDGFAKREAATRFLAKVLRDTDGCRNYTVLLAVKKARDSKDAEIRRRASDLYETNHGRYLREFPYFCVFTTAEFGKMGLSSDAVERLARIVAGFKTISWGYCKGEGLMVMCVTPKNIDSSKIAIVKKHSEVTRIVPIKDEYKIPWLNIQR